MNEDLLRPRATGRRALRCWVFRVVWVLKGKGMEVVVTLDVYALLGQIERWWWQRFGFEFLKTLFSVIKCNHSPPSSESERLACGRCIYGVLLWVTDMVVVWWGIGFVTSSFLSFIIKAEFRQKRRTCSIIIMVEYQSWWWCMIRVCRSGWISSLTCTKWDLSWHSCSNRAISCGWDERSFLPGGQNGIWEISNPWLGATENQHKTKIDNRITKSRRGGAGASDSSRKTISATKSQHVHSMHPGVCKSN